MKIGVLILGSLGVLSLSGLAAAAGAPPARTGFQMDIRTGFSVPMGQVYGAGDGLNSTSEGQKVSDVTKGQVPFFVDIGGKLIPQLFLGGYFGFAISGAGGRFKDQCSRANLSCATASVHLGIEAQYHILPDAFANPWIGYGLGIESLALSNGNTDISYTGFQFARFMGGVDFRVNRVFGVGPFIDFSMSQYSSVKGEGSRTYDIPNTATHEWLTLGARFVFFP